MHCTACAMNIDGELEDTAGVKQSETSYAKQQTSVVYDDAKIDADKIITIIKNTGYEATVISRQSA